VKSIVHITAIQVLLLLGLSSTDAHADGGIMRLRQAQGPFVITIFTTPELVPHRPVDVSVLVQRRDSSDVILDADVDLLLTPPPVAVVTAMDPICAPGGVGFLSPESAGHNADFSTPATRAQASNKLLYAAAVEFGSVGDWTLDATVKARGGSERFSCSIPVGPSPRQLTGLLPYLLLPPMAIALFALNQFLRKSRRGSQDSDCTAATDESSSPRRTNDTTIRTQRIEALPQSILPIDDPVIQNLFPQSGSDLPATGPDCATEFCVMTPNRL